MGVPQTGRVSENSLAECDRGLADAGRSTGSRGTCERLELRYPVRTSRQAWTRHRPSGYRRMPAALARCRRNGFVGRRTSDVAVRRDATRPNRILINVRPWPRARRSAARPLSRRDSLSRNSNCQLTSSD